MRSKDFRTLFLSVICLLIPCLFGVIGMVKQHISMAIWIQNPLFILVLAFLWMFLIRIPIKWNFHAVTLASVLLLGFTFLGPSMDGVHRWLKFPFFTLNLSAIVMPITIVALYRLMEEEKVGFSVACILLIALMLYLQPDASQLLAFSIPILMGLIRSKRSRLIKFGVCVLLLFLTWQSWLHLDALPPVNYTEGVFALLKDSSILLYGIGIVALLWVPVYFLLASMGKVRAVCLGIAAYYWLMIASTWMGNFPVPFMGYGISPILGFYIFLLWFIPAASSPHAPRETNACWPTQ